MVRKTAVFLENGKICPAVTADTVCLYVKNDCKWQAEIIPFTVGEVADFKQMRQSVTETISRLSDCKIVVASKMGGILYNVFNNADFVIMETDIFDEKSLDDIYDQALSENSNTQIVDMPLDPVEQADGEFFYDFYTLKKKLPGITSKMTILPFIRKKEFRQFTIACSHVMPWLPEEVERLQLMYRVEEEDQKVIVTVYNESK
ncbi:MAG: Fe-only nitrogenase accessory AnfO family protein [Lachnospiraceae bacterium]|nr:Fe-only nitrogenase accessory AnfO family protein [Lachnospiraceae bacterium]